MELLPASPVALGLAIALLAIIIGFSVVLWQRRKSAKPGKPPPVKGVAPPVQQSVPEEKKASSPPQTAVPPQPQIKFSPTQTATQGASPPHSSISQLGLSEKNAAPQGGKGLGTVPKKVSFGREGSPVVQAPSPTGGAPPPPKTQPPPPSSKGERIGKKKLAMLAVILFLVSTTAVAVYLVYQQQLLLPKAKASRVTFTLEPSDYSFSLGEQKTFSLKASFEQTDTATETLDGLRTAVFFSTDYLKVPEEAYVDTRSSGFGEIALVDNPSEANKNGRIVIELLAKTKGGGPSTQQAITIAHITFEAKTQTPSPQQITIGKSQVVNNEKQVIPADTQGATYTVGAACPTPGVGEPQSQLIFDAQPQQYPWTIEEPKYGSDDLINETFDQYGGQTFEGNKNPYGIEVYICESNEGVIKSDQGKALDYFTKRSHDICIPRQDENNQIWPDDVFPNLADLSCKETQFLVDGPPQNQDRRVENRSKDICTTTIGQPGANPHLDVTVDFTFTDFMTQPGNEVVLAGRADPQSEECADLPQNPTQVPLSLTPDQLSCYLYFDDFAKVSVWQESATGEEPVVESKIVRYTSGDKVHPVPGPSVSLNDLFSQGPGDYKVQVELFDEGASVYGSGDLWLTWKSAPPACPPVSPSPTPGFGQCQDLKIYDLDWNQLKVDDLAGYVAGDRVRIAAVTANRDSVTKARIRVKQGEVYTEWQETTTLRPQSGELPTKEFYIEYEFPPEATTFTVEAEVFEGGEWH